MTKEELASKLDGNEYRNELPDALNELAKESGLLVVYGGSDDLIYLGGIGDQELSCYGGGDIILKFNPETNEVEGQELNYLYDLEDSKLEKEWEAEYRKNNYVEAQWCIKEGYSWSYKCSLPHSKFDIIDEGENYCEGIVIDVSSLKL